MNGFDDFGFADMFGDRDRVREIVDRVPDLQPILAELDAMYAAEMSIPPAGWHPPTQQLQLAVDLYIAKGHTPADALTRYYRAWRIGEHDHGRMLIRALEHGVRQAGYTDPSWMP